MTFISSVNPFRQLRYSSFHVVALYICARRSSRSCFVLALKIRNSSAESRPSSTPELSNCSVSNRSISTERSFSDGSRVLRKHQMMGNKASVPRTPATAPQILKPCSDIGRRVRWQDCQTDIKRFRWRMYRGKDEWKEQGRRRLQTGLWFVIYSRGKSARGYWEHGEGLNR
ncbi:hypothetical protein BD413DRAFT_309119 [Trametes elegans]|nr:hypothetical protein BD413DRAFT_309119 [Trametes elegans]